MSPNELELWQRIDAFDFDQGGQPLHFARRLARENDWSVEHALRVIAEYRRFTFLARSAGHPVSPSDAVDQVWHKHITFTRTYWDEFCTKVLGKPLHHEPSKGGKQESAKFENWYERTLESYRQFFQEEPPGDIWPPMEIRQKEDDKFVRINTARNWVIPKFWIRSGGTSGAAAVATLCMMSSVGCLPLAASALNPLDLKGHDFLIFFWVTAAMAWIAGFCVRTRFKRPSEPKTSAPPHLDPYTVALLAGDDGRAVNAAIAALVLEKALAFEPGSDRIKKVGEFQARYPLEKHLLSVVPVTGISREVLHTLTLPWAKQTEAEMRSHGLLVSEEDSNKATWIPLAFSFAVLLMGAAKVLVGLSRDRPVLYLVLSCAVFLFVTIPLFARGTKRSIYGDRFIKELKEEHAILETRPLSRTTMAGAALPLAIGLFGSSVLANTPYPDLQHRLSPSGGGDGGSGIGGGDGGGGDGGCGGGCGGCGGGD